MTILIPEVGLSHEGQMSYARGYILWAAHLYDRLDVPPQQRVIKFQCHLPEYEPWQQWRPGTPWTVTRDRDRLEYLADTSFDEDEWGELSALAHDHKLQFWCSVFAPETVAFLDWRVDVWKVPHTRANDKPLAEALLARKEPIVLSWPSRQPSGTYERTLYDAAADVQFLACYPENPTPLAWVRQVLVEGPRALSLHMDPHDFPLVIGDIARLRVPKVELHICYSRHIDLPDAPWSLELSEFEAALARCQEAG